MTELKATRDYKGRIKIAGMTHKDTMILARMFNFETTNEPKMLTVEEYLEKYPETKVEEFTSKKGNELIKVYFPDGEVRQYGKRHMNSCTFRY